MAAPDRRISAFALAPGGRVGRALGWRWIFPLGTLPMPWHPLLLPLLLAAVGGTVASQLYLIVSGNMASAGDASWALPLWIGLGLAVPLSLPFVQWLFYALRVHLVQAAMAPAAMLLLAVAIARGIEPLVMAAIPAGYFALHALTAAASRWRLRQLERDNAAVAAAVPIVLPDAPLLLSGLPAAEMQRRLGRASVLVRSDKGEIHGRCLLDPADAEALAPLVRQAGDRRYRLGKETGVDVLSYPAPADARECVVLRARGWSPGPLLAGRMQTLAIARPGVPTLHYHLGGAAPFAWFPGFALFFHLSISAGGFQRMIGFLRGRPREIGGNDAPAAILSRLLALPAEGRVMPAAPVAEMRRMLLERIRARREEQRASFEALLADPGGWKQSGFDLLQDEPERIAARAAGMCEALVRAREAHASLALHALARLIAKLPPEVFAANGGVILKALDSRELLAEPRIVKNVDGRKKPLRFYGFGLLSHVPELYRRLGELGEPARRLIEEAGELARWPEPLATARERLESGG